MSRFSLPLFALLFSTLAAPLAARADSTETFTFTPENYGSALTFTLTPSNISLGVDGIYCVLDATATNGDGLTLTFFNASFVAHYGAFGDLDLNIVDGTTNLQYYVDGPQLYTGVETAPDFIPGTYTLTGDPSDYSADSGTLQIGASMPTGAATPEPASIALLATGLLGLLWMERRRWASNK